MRLWRDNSGAVLSAEMTVLLAIVVAGVAVGANQLRNAVNSELGEIASGIRSLDQTPFMRSASTPCLSVPSAFDGLVDRVDLIELNHVYDGCGKAIFTQAIFYSGGEVAAWRLVKSESHRPERDWRTGEWVMRWTDGERLRIVRSEDFRESFSQYDIEMDERTRFPVELRRGLLFERNGGVTW